MIRLTDKGLFCEAGGFHIDPSRKVDVALITHAHSDHARRGSRQYVCVASGAGLLRKRIGDDARIQEVAYREILRFGNVRVSFHPAGHILGSSQIRIESDSGSVWVVSGDYKRDRDPSCDEFEVVPCDTFVTEATFGNPKYAWGDTSQTVAQIFAWWEANRAQDRNSLLYAYALGKSQRVLAELTRHTDRPVHVFGETESMNECYRVEGIRMVPTIALESLPSTRKLQGELIVAPHSINHSPWFEKLGDCETAFASGWMATRRWGFGRQLDRGFVLSDHADFDALVGTVQETGARRVIVHHGGDDALVRHFRRLGLQAELLVKESERAPLPLFDAAAGRATV
jgi:putative mRNA 3-end processing factor